MAACDATKFGVAAESREGVSGAMFRSAAGCCTGDGLIWGGKLCGAGAFASGESAATTAGVACFGAGAACCGAGG